MKFTKAGENYVFVLYCFSYVKLDLNSAQGMPKLVSIGDQNHAGLTSKSMFVARKSTPFSTTSLESQESYLTNMSLHDQRFFPPAVHSAFARLHNAAASPTSRLRSRLRLITVFRQHHRHFDRLQN